VEEDIQWAKKNQVDYAPLVFPSHVDHFSTRPNGSHQLRPKERALIAGDKRIIIFFLSFAGFAFFYFKGPQTYQVRIPPGEIVKVLIKANAHL